MTNERALALTQNKMHDAGLLFRVDSREGVIKGTFKDDKGHQDRPTFFELSFHDGYLINVTGWDLKVGTQDFERKSVNVAFINNDLICGNFLVDIVKGMILYKNVMSFTALEHCDKEEMLRFVSLPTAMFFENEEQLKK